MKIYQFLLISWTYSRFFIRLDLSVFNNFFFINRFNFIFLSILAALEGVNLPHFSSTTSKLLSRCCNILIGGGTEEGWSKPKLIEIYNSCSSTFEILRFCICEVPVFEYLKYSPACILSVGLKVSKTLSVCSLSVF